MVLFRLDTTDDRNMPSNIVDRVAGLNVQGDRLASQGLHEDLHCCCERRIETLWNMQGTGSPTHTWAEHAEHSVTWDLGVESSVTAKLKTHNIAESLPVKQWLARRCHEPSSLLRLTPWQPKS